MGKIYNVRLDELREMLAARTNSEGKALRGYTENVVSVRREIERLTVLAALDKTQA